MMNDIQRRLSKLENKQSDIPMGFVVFEDGRREKWDLPRIARAFLGDGCGVVRVEWVRHEPGLLLQLLANEEYWDELREVRREQN